MLSVSSVVFGVNFLILSPPLWVDHRVQACRTSALLFELMGVFKLKSLLRAVLFNAARSVLRAFSSPVRWRFPSNSLRILELSIPFLTIDNRFAVLVDRWFFDLRVFLHMGHILVDSNLLLVG